MKKTKTLPKIVGITEMMKFFNCSRSTVYNKYVPHLNRFPTKENKVYFLLEDVVKLKDELPNDKDYEVVTIESITDLVV